MYISISLFSYYLSTYLYVNITRKKRKTKNMNLFKKFWRSYIFSVTQKCIQKLLQRLKIMKYWILAHFG